MVIKELKSPVVRSRILGWVAVYSFLVVPLWGAGCSRSLQAVPPEALRSQAADASNAPKSTADSPVLEVPPTQTYLINPGDQLHISVRRRSDLGVLIDETLLVPPDGKLPFPLIGELSASGQTVAEVRDKLTTFLSEFIVSPVVTVALTKVTKSKVYVLGEVKNPGIYTIETNTSALEALAMAGGLTPSARRSFVLLLRGDGSPTGGDRADLVKLDLKRLIETADVKQNVLLQRNDVLYVPPNFGAKTDRLFQHVGSVLTPLAPIIGLVGTAIIVSGSSGN